MSKLKYFGHIMHSSDSIKIFDVRTDKWQWKLTLNLPTTTIVAQPFNVIKWQLKFNPVA